MKDQVLDKLIKEQSISALETFYARLQNRSDSCATMWKNKIHEELTQRGIAGQE